ncbi:MAG: peptide deformylase [Bdellovibrionaceae bacterium]|nr:peptide deformylase [Pseudobdellovibrionaceae bacterium]NUM59632.1 peptide deformylase [Pseudobdellovibrionaceae bacterium]
MSILKILKYPDPTLREISEPVEIFDEKLARLTENMIETMYDAKGIGLAAPQVGVLQRVVVIDTRPKDEEGRRYKYEEMAEFEKQVTQPLLLINPRIIKGQGKTTFDEGCLSIPSFYETVNRHEVIEVETYDLKGNKKTFKADGLLAICIQHELDHLEGKLFIDHLSFLKSSKIKNQIKKSGYPEKPKEKAEKKS